MKNRQLRSREEYTLEAISKAWPGGEWVESKQDAGVQIPPLPEGAELPAGSPGGSDQPQPSTLTIIGGTKYDEDALRKYLKQLPRWTRVIAGDGRGAERFSMIGAVDEFKIIPCEIAPDTDRYGKQARKVNVEQVLSYDLNSPVLLVGTGERVKQAKAWLKRANWDREVIELA